VKTKEEADAADLSSAFVGQTNDSSHTSVSRVLFISVLKTQVAANASGSRLLDHYSFLKLLDFVFINAA